MNIMVLAGFWLRHSHRNTLTVSNKYSIGGLRRSTDFLSSAPCFVAGEGSDGVIEGRG